MDTSTPVATAASTTTGAGATVVVAMGHLSDPANTFYELFDRAAGSSSWTLATPPGVADNGGLVVGPSASGTLTVGFLPSADLTFSVLARSSDGGTTWSPGEVPGALASEEDALATGPTGGAAALLAGPGGPVVEAGPALTSWTRLVTTGELVVPGDGCRPVGITAVSISPSGTVVVGTRCSAATRIGVFAATGTAGSTGSSTGRTTGWSPVGTAVPGAPATTSVLRLSAGPVSPTVLAESERDGRTTVLASWGTVGPTVGLPVPPGWSVRATSVGGASGQGESVLLGADSGSGLEIESTAGPGRAWVKAPTPPAGSTAVATVGTETDAFVPSGSRLAVWASSSGGPWTRVDRLSVPIQYGSSS